MRRLFDPMVRVAGPRLRRWITRLALWVLADDALAAQIRARLGAAQSAPVPPAPAARRRYAKEYLRDLPSWTGPSQPPARADELQAAVALRRQLLFSERDVGAPYMIDIVRAFRLIENASLYIEVGTFDKGNLAYAASLLADDATLIDVDIESWPEQSEKVQNRLKPRQVLETVVGDSSAPETIERVLKILDGRQADAVFIDADHSAHSAFADYAAYAPLVRPGGFVLFHDVYWRGDEAVFGCGMAIEQIDRHVPVHVIFGDDPVHRYLPWLGKQDTIWGGVGVLQR